MYKTVSCKGERMSLYSGSTMCKGEGQLQLRQAGYSKLNIAQNAVQYLCTIIIATVVTVVLWHLSINFIQTHQRSAVFHFEIDVQLGLCEGQSDQNRSKPVYRLHVWKQRGISVCTILWCVRQDHATSKSKRGSGLRIFPPTYNRVGGSANQSARNIYPKRSVQS